MINLIKNNKLSTVIVIIYVGLFIMKKEMAFEALDHSTYYLFEMIQILPVIFMLTVSIDVLIPKQWIVKRLGMGSGISGSILALAFGSLSAGPIYAAFPIVKMLHKKGASIRNLVIILSAWAVIKVPMLANEVKFLGPKFMFMRWLLTVAFIFIIAWIMEKSHLTIEDHNHNSTEAIAIKDDFCIGCGYCHKSIPELFTMSKGKALVCHHDIQLKTMDSTQIVKLKATAEKCPTHAIIIND